MCLETSASESGEKDVNECMFAGKMCWTVCGVENCAVRFVMWQSRQLLELMKEGEEEDKGGRKMF